MTHDVLRKLVGHVTERELTIALHYIRGADSFAAAGRKLNPPVTRQTASRFFANIERRAGHSINWKSLRPAREPHQSMRITTRGRHPSLAPRDAVTLRAA